MTVIYLTTGTKWVAPNNISTATVECIGGGAGGDSVGGAGGGGAYSKSTGVSITPGTTYAYAIGAGGAAGVAGGDTNFNASAILAKGGGAPTTVTGGSGGSAGSGVGGTKFSGGNGGSVASANPGGGGGAGGSTGDGQNGGSGGGAAGGNGGGGDAGVGGAGGTGTAGTGGTGGNGTEYTTTGLNGGPAGSGGGGGGGITAGGPGGNYGGGGGGGLTTGAAGANGLIVITYTPTSQPTIYTYTDATVVNFPTPSDAIYGIKVEGIGGGGGGVINTQGGGGGAYATVPAFSSTPGANYALQIGAGGVGGGASGTDSLFNSTTLVAKAGANGGAGGAAASCTPTLNANSGGTGGTANSGNGGGGGAGGPNSAGALAGNGGSGGANSGGGGGGGANNSAGTGGNGGNNNGVGGTAGSGANGGGNGGAGGAGTNAAGAAGSTGTLWAAAVGPGGGGGGGGAGAPGGTGGAGALYGAGSGAGSAATTGAQGIIVITYSPQSFYEFAIESTEQMSWQRHTEMAGYSSGGGIYIPALANWILSGASIDMFFTSSLYYDGSPSAPAISSLLLCSRSAPAITYAATISGNLTAFAPNTLRITNLGLLIEETRTNLTFPSGGIDTWPTPSGVTRSAGIADPFGTITGVTITANAGGPVAHYVRSSGAARASGSAYIAWVLVQQGTAPYAVIGTLSDTTFRWATLQWSDLSVSVTGGTASVTRLGTSNWYYLALSYTSGNTGLADVVVGPGSVTAASIGNANYVFIAAGTETVIAAVGQTELGSFSTSYIPTTVASVTRSADDISANSTILSIFNGSGSSLYVQSGGSQRPTTAVGVNTHTATEEDPFYLSASTTITSFINANKATAVLGSGTNSSVSKYGFSKDASGHSLVANNGTLVTDTGTFAACTTMSIGGIVGGAATTYYNGYFQRLTFWASKITDLMLRTFTA